MHNFQPINYILRNTIPILYKSKAAQLILDAAEIIMAEA